MDQPCDQFLAGADFAGDPHRCALRLASMVPSAGRLDSRQAPFFDTGSAGFLVVIGSMAALSVLAVWVGVRRSRI